MKLNIHQIINIIGKLELRLLFTKSSTTEHRVYIVDSQNQKLNKARKVSQKIEKLEAGLFTQKTAQTIKDIFNEVMENHKGYQIATKQLIEQGRI
ncbi:hypothetical protein [Salinicola rhizosphaerae]|uniref:Uncharacterized protein n=1 Tax=Salinicola rhizosphaerae TaxID=1443141 RepID=A0ABQ3DRA4_9GAMM|nr:hypothetical protein [Salinicola rhizosphaerae]GHB12881.1 hypothetical protein GCM10009038_08630 [Salinicola rhizosphaerae]